MRFTKTSLGLCVRHSFRQSKSLLQRRLNNPDRTPLQLPLHPGPHGPALLRGVSVQRARARARALSFADALLLRSTRARPRAARVSRRRPRPIRLLQTQDWRAACEGHT